MVSIHFLIELVGGAVLFGTGLLMGLYLAPDEDEEDEDSNE